MDFHKLLQHMFFMYATCLATRTSLVLILGVPDLSALHHVRHDIWHRIRADLENIHDEGYAKKHAQNIFL